MPKSGELKHALIIFENEYELLYAFRSLSSDNRSMAEMLSHLLSPRMLSTPGDQLTRIGATRLGAHPSAIVSPDDIPPSKRKHSRTFHLSGLELTVTEPGGKVSYTGPLAGFIANYYSTLKTARALLAHDRKMDRQRKRRKERKELDAYGEQHKQNPPELAKKLKKVSLEEAERLMKRKS